MLLFIPTLLASENKRSQITVLFNLLIQFLPTLGQKSDSHCAALAQKLTMPETELVTNHLTLFRRFSSVLLAVKEDVNGRHFTGITE